MTAFYDVGEVFRTLLCFLSNIQESSSMRFLILVLALATLGADWPQFHGPQRDGLSPETGLARTWPATGLKQLWEMKAGSGWSGPVVAGERALLFHRIDDEEVLDCVDATTGKPLWNHRYKTRYRDDFISTTGRVQHPRSLAIKSSRSGRMAISPRLSWPPANGSGIAT